MRNTLRILFAVVLAFTMCVAGFALTLDTAESATETSVIPADAALAAVHAPGLNALTGTADVVTFDEENAADYFATFTADNYDSKEIAALPAVLDPNGTGGNAAKFYHAAFEEVNSEIWHTINQSTAIGDGTRKYLFRYDMSHVAGEGTAEETALVTNRWAALQHIYNSTASPHASVSTAVNAWYKQNISLVPKNDYKFSFRHRVGTSAGTSSDTGACTVAIATYFDNIGFYPYYYATYMVDGEELSKEQFLLDGDGKIMTAYATKNDNYPANTVDENGNSVECIGWSIYENATEPMTTVTLANQDLVLYPVWAQIGIIDSTTDWIKGAKDAESGMYDSVYVEATEGVTVDKWTVDVGNTKATYEIGENNVFIQAAGYPGEVTVTATAGDITAVKVIRVVGRDAGNYIIGVDIISGTENGWSFDNTDDENAIVGALGRSSSYGVEANGNKYMNFAWTVGRDDSKQDYPQYVLNGYPGSAVIGSRPLQFKADVLGNRGNFWILNFNTLAINSGFGNASAWTTSKFKITAAGTGTTFNFQVGLSQTQASYKIDNISVTPYYKVTYYDFGSNVVAEEWVLPEDGVFVPDLSKVEGATGFATELGGEAVPAITLANEDIHLFAVTEKVINFVGGGEFAKVDVTIGSYTIPSAEDLDMDVENFRLWKDSEGNYYYVGDVVEDVTTLSGKTFTAQCFEAPLEDATKGKLIFFFDYEGVTDKNHATYLDKSYSTGTASRWDGNALGTRQVEADGNAVCYVKGGSYQLFGYGINYNEKTVGGKATVEFDFKYITVENYKTGSRFMRMLSHPNETTTGDPPSPIGATGDKYYNTGITMPADRYDGKWHHAVSTKVDTDKVGLKGGITQYQGIPANSEQVFDNYAFYLYPAKTFAVYEAEGSENFEFVTVEGDTYTFEAKEGVLAYTDGKDNYFKIGVAYPVADLQFKALYPFSQDASKPAVIYIFEGDKGVDGSKVTQGNGSSNYGETIIDEGRTVLHLHAWNKKANKDYRLTFKYSEQYDVNEYKHFQAVYKTNNVYKADNTAAAGYAPEASWASCFYLNYNGSGGYYTTAQDGTTVLYQFNSRSYTDADANDYVIVEKDISTIGTKEGYPIGYGVSFDPVNTGADRWGHDIFIDYIRVYRAGVTTVTYDTNAPEGATVLAEVPADTNRGIGTGYLLKGLRPAVEGYDFRGWALTPDATVADVVDSIDLTGDTTVYAVWTADAETVAPATTDKYEIRGGATNNGIRFISTIRASEKANLEEFGFIATRATLLGDKELTFNFKKDDVATIEGSKLYVTGVAYDKDGDIDMINGEEADGSIVYTAVTTGIPMTAKNENMVIRTYAKYTVGGNELVVYGNTMTNSLYNVAKAIADENGEAYANNKAYIDSILAE